MYDHFNNSLTPEEHEKREANRLNRLRIMKERSEDEQDKKALKQEGERLRKEREEQSQSKKVKLNNPRWIHVNTDLQVERPDSVYIGETIKLIVDQENGNDKPIEFLVKDSKIQSRIDPEKGVDEVLSKIESPSPEVEWTVIDPRCKKEMGRKMDVYFFAKSRDISSAVCKITVLTVSVPDFAFSK